MAYKDKIEVILKELWKPDCEDNSEAYNMALQDVQTAIDSMNEETENDYVLGGTKSNKSWVMHPEAIPHEEMSVIEDLKAEINRWLREGSNKTKFYDYDIKATAYHFANWQKLQMVKDAVEKRIETNFLRAYLCMYVDELGFEPGDKVKVIIFKEDRR